MIWFCTWIILLVLVPRVAWTIAIWTVAAPLIGVALFNLLIFALMLRDLYHV